MADTIYYNAQGTEIPFDSLPEELRHYVEDSIQTTQEQLPSTNEKSDPGYTPFIIVMTSIVVLGIVAVRRSWKTKGTEILGGWKDPVEITDRGFFAEEKYTDAEERFRDITKDYLVYHGRDLFFADEQYEKILGKHSAYYRRLSPELQETFVRRTKKFLSGKTFLIKSNEPFVEMPVLLSASAVQLTFGLDKYQLPHYQYIRIYQEEYFAKGSLRILAGHVYGNTITVAWNQFLKGNEAPADGVNLGLHEMAHALYFQLVEADNGRCRRFKSNFDTVMAEGAEVYQLKHTIPSDLFTENAYRNLQEFWAESVELFFERPLELKREYTELYDIMKEILNQDPVNTLHPVQSE